MSLAERSSPGSSATPPPSILPKIKKSAKGKGKKKQYQAQDRGKNEGVDLNWAFTPPPGAVLLEEDVDAGEFDWDKINDDEDLELCLIRVPDSVKPKHLENIQLDMPISSMSSSQSACVGVLKRKYTTFDIWSVGNDGEQPVGGEELKSISCLLPRKKKKGKLYPAPKPFVHHLLVSAQSVVPTPYVSSSSTDGTQPSITTGPPYKNPPRQSYPKAVLKHRFMPYGSLVNLTNETDIDTHEEETVMNVDNKTPEPQPTVPPRTKRKQGKTVDEILSKTPKKPSTTTETDPEGDKAKGKKRKGESTDTPETPAPKKSKKFKY